MSFVFNSLPLDAPLRITSKFGKRQTGILGATTNHQGIDLGRDFSKIQTNVLAVKEGTISGNYWNDYRGWVITINHGGMYCSLYQHLKYQSPLKVGAKVNAGDIIGILGSSCNPKKIKISPHLHFELYYQGKTIDPEPFLKNIKEIKKMTDFIDVPAGAWYEKAIAFVTEQGYMQGSGGNKFEPEKPLTRAQMAQVLYNIFYEKEEK